tara:strand:+ start:9061 stop:9498 length:438 start_codon:yes stop_codon:yes gene_type:complete
MGLLSAKKANTITGYLLTPQREIKEINVEVDSPMLTWRPKGGDPMSWLLQKPVRAMMGIGPYVLLRPDKLEPLAPDSNPEDKVNPELLTRAFNKRHAEVTQTPLKSALGSILMLDMVLCGLAVVFGLFICMMLFPQVIEIMDFGG